MARKRKKEEEAEEDYEFVPPEFDEREFLEKDLKGTRGVLISAVYAVVLALAAFLLSSVNMLLGWLPLLVGLATLQYMFKLVKVPEDAFEKKTALIGNYLILVFLFLGIWIVALNPPMSDHAPPAISDIQVSYLDDGEWISVSGSSSTFQLNLADGPVNMTSDVVDNGGLSNVKAYRNWTFDGETHSLLVDMDLASDNVYEMRFNASEDFGNETGIITYFVQIIAEDNSGNISEADLQQIKVTVSA